MFRSNNITLRFFKVGGMTLYNKRQLKYMLKFIIVAWNINEINKFVWCYSYYIEQACHQEWEISLSFLGYIFMWSPITNFCISRCEFFLNLTPFVWVTNSVCLRQRCLRKTWSVVFTAYDSIAKAADKNLLGLSIGAVMTEEVVRWLQMMERHGLA